MLSLPHWTQTLELFPIFLSSCTVFKNKREVGAIWKSFLICQHPTFLHHCHLRFSNQHQFPFFFFTFSFLNTSNCFHGSNWWSVAYFCTSSHLGREGTSFTFGCSLLCPLYITFLTYTPNSISIHPYLSLPSGSLPTLSTAGGRDTVLPLCSLTSQGHSPPGRLWHGAGPQWTSHRQNAGNFCLLAQLSLL